MVLTHKISHRHQRDDGQINKENKNGASKYLFY